MRASTSPALVLPALRRRRFVAFAFNTFSSLSQYGILQESFLGADVVTRVSGNRGREGSQTLASRRSAAFERHILHPTKAARESILQFYPVSHSTCPVCVRVMQCVRSVCCVNVWVCPHELVLHVCMCVRIDIYLAGIESHLAERFLLCFENNMTILPADGEVRQICSS
jgi:hypothetical protein